jgi:hypothetical protein
MKRLLASPIAPRAVLAAAATQLVAALVGLAGLPTGAATAAATVPEGGRVAASVPVAGVRVMVLSTSGRLSLLVAYSGEKGWHGIEVDPAPAGSVAAWAATVGSREVPALSAVYGRAQGGRVRVDWADGRVAETDTAADGTYLVARPGRVRSAHVSVLGEDGVVVTAMDGP